MEQDIPDVNSGARDVGDIANPQRYGPPPRSFPGLGFSLASLLNNTDTRSNDKGSQDVLSGQRTLDFFTSALSNMQNSHAHQSDRENMTMKPQSDLPNAAGSNIQNAASRLNSQIHEKKKNNNNNKLSEFNTKRNCVTKIH